MGEGFEVGWEEEEKEAEWWWRAVSIASGEIRWVVLGNGTDVLVVASIPHSRKLEFGMILCCEVANRVRPFLSISVAVSQAFLLPSAERCLLLVSSLLLLPALDRDIVFCIRQTCAVICFARKSIPNNGCYAFLTEAVSKITLIYLSIAVADVFETYGNDQYPLKGNLTMISDR